MAWSRIAGMPWNTDLELVGGLLLFAMLFRAAVRSGWRRYASDTPFPTASAMRIDLVLVLFYLAVGSPLDELADTYLFSAHMLQHSVLIFLLPPLIYAAVPPFVFKPLTESEASRRLFAFAVHPVTGLVTFNLVFALWHIPWLYELALRDRKVHEAEHLMFLITALQMWWPVLSRSEAFPPLGPGARVVYLFLMSITQIPLFAFLVLSGDQYYPTYARAPRLFPLTPLEDQGLGGILMKVFGEVVFGGYLLYTFVLWYESERRARSRPAPPSTAPQEAFERT